MTDITYRQASRTYPGRDHDPAVDQLDLAVQDGEFLVLVGPSGSGKSTALRMVAGLEEIDEGEVYLGLRAVSGMAPRERDVAMVFQTYALYPHMTVAENMGFALKLRGTAKADREYQVRTAAKLLDLTAYLDRTPKELSGGQRQRVAMGRAIVREPSAFLMDEPLSNLDAKLRVETRAHISALQRRLGTTTLYVTHDQVEAMTMGDRVAVLDGGRLQQCANPRELYERPANAFVAAFIGSPAMNLLKADVAVDGVDAGGLTARLTTAQRRLVTKAGLSTVLLGVRPESLRVRSGSGPGLRIGVGLVEELGADSYVHGEPVDVTGIPANRASASLRIRVDGRHSPAAGDTITVTVDESTPVHLFHPETGQRVGP